MVSSSSSSGIVKKHPSTIVLRYSRLLFNLFISRHVSFELYITYTVSFTSTSVIVYEDGPDGKQ